jgi:hypothetical protein
MKIAIQGLGEVPTTIRLLLEKEKPDVSYIICSDYHLKYTASHRANYKEPNKKVIEAAAKRVKSKVVFHRCNAFNPKSVAKVIREILRGIDPSKDKVIINYTGGTAVVRLFLGATAVVLSALMKTKIVYAIEYPKGIKITKDHTKALRENFPTDLGVLLELKKKRSSRSKSQESKQPKP